jgi:hypothetical protein
MKVIILALILTTAFSAHSSSKKYECKGFGDPQGGLLDFELIINSNGNYTVKGAWAETVFELVSADLEYDSTLSTYLDVIDYTAYYSYQHNRGFFLGEAPYKVYASDGVDAITSPESILITGQTLVASKENVDGSFKAYFEIFFNSHAKHGSTTENIFTCSLK